MIQESVQNQLAKILKPMQGQDGEKEPKLWAKKTRKSKEKSQEEGRKDMLMEKSTSKATCCPEMAFFFFSFLEKSSCQTNALLCIFIQFSHWKNTLAVEITLYAKKLLSLELPQIKSLVILLMEYEIRDFGLNTA